MFRLFNRGISRHRITQLSDSSSSTKRWTISCSVRYFSVVQRCSRDCIIHYTSLGSLSDGRISSCGIGAVFWYGKTTSLFSLAGSQQVQSVSCFGRADAHLPLDEEVSWSIAVETCRAILSVKSATHVARRFMHGLLVVAQRLHIGVFRVLEAIFLREATIIVMDIRVTASSICVIMHGFRRASNASAGPLKIYRGTFETAALLLGSWPVHDCESTAVQAHICISARAICIVDICPTSCRQNTHSNSFKYKKQIK